MLSLEEADNKRRDLAHTSKLEKASTLTYDAELPPISKKLFRQRYRKYPEFRLHVDEHQ